MNTVLWSIQVLLAATFFIAGALQLILPVQKLSAWIRVKWLNDLHPVTLRMIGAVEILGALGLIVPAWTGVLPWLTALAAVGLALVMVGATIGHLRHKEYLRSVLTLIFIVLACFVAYGRFFPMPT